MKRLGKTRQRLLQVKDQISVAYKNGWSLRELAKIHQTSPGSIRAILLELGADMQRPGRKKKEK